MKGRYVLAPEAALDLVQIWRYIKKKASVEMADRVESVIRDKIVFLAGQPGGGTQHSKIGIRTRLRRLETQEKTGLKRLTVTEGHLE